MRHQRTLYVSNSLLRRDVGRREQMNLIHRTIAARDNSRRDHSGQSSQKFLSSLNWEHAPRDQRRVVWWCGTTGRQRQRRLRRRGRLSALL